MVEIRPCWQMDIDGNFSYGKSGYGREKGCEALWNCVQTKNVAIKH